MSTWNQSIDVAILFIVVFAAAACGRATDTEPPSSTTVTIAVDSEWQIPPGFNVMLPVAYGRVIEMLKNDSGAPPDLPDFSMSGKVAAAEDAERVLIAAYSDGVSSDARPTGVLTSWIELFGGAEFAEPVTSDRGGLHLATSRGQAQGLAQSSPQGVLLIVISEPDTQRVWRLMCAVSSEVMSDEVVRVCEEVRDEFRPIPLSTP